MELPLVGWIKRYWIKPSLCVRYSDLPKNMDTDGRTDRQTNRQTHRQTETHRHTHTRAHARARTHARTYACTHARTYACTHARTYARYSRKGFQHTNHLRFQWLIIIFFRFCVDEFWHVLRFQLIMRSNWSCSENTHPVWQSEDKSVQTTLTTPFPV